MSVEKYIAELNRAAQADYGPEAAYLLEQYAKHKAAELFGGECQCVGCKD